MKLLREGDFLRMEYVCGDQPPGPLTLIPEDLDAPHPRFFTSSEGSRLAVEFRLKGDDAEFVFERYKFRRMGKVP